MEAAAFEREVREEGAEIDPALLGRHILTTSMAIPGLVPGRDPLFQRVVFAGVTLANSDFLRLQDTENTIQDRVQQEYARPVIRAERLLSRMLTSEQKATWERYDYFSVRSRMNPRVTYRINRRGTIRMVTVGRRRTNFKNLCISPVERLPDGDRVLALKLLAEHQEQELLSTANIFPN